jgi:ethanolamine ammonia-lyase small subunit
VLELKQQLPNLKGVTATAEKDPQAVENAAQAEEKPKARRGTVARKAGKQAGASKPARKV